MEDNVFKIVFCLSEKDNYFVLILSVLYTCIYTIVNLKQIHMQTTEEHHELIFAYTLSTMFCLQLYSMYQNNGIKQNLSITM